MLSSICSMSCATTLLMVFVMTSSFLNLYRMMYPLSVYDLKSFGDERNFVKPLWDSASTMHMRIYLSTNSRFNFEFLENDVYPSSDISNDEEIATVRKAQASASGVSLKHQLLWDEKLNSPSFSKSFLLTSCDDTIESCKIKDQSYRFASGLLDQSERIAIDRGEGGVLSALSAAGHGVESTSALLTLYQWLINRIKSLFSLLSLSTTKRDESMHEDSFGKKESTQHGILDRTIVHVPSKSPMWKSLHSNNTLYVHVLLIRTDDNKTVTTWPPTSYEGAATAIQKASRSGALLMGKVNMIRHEVPHHIGKPKRILFQDLVYLYRKYVKYSREMPPWVMEISKPEEYEAYQHFLEHKKNGSGYPYWKPEVSIKYVNDDSYYPIELTRLSGMPTVSVPRTSKHPSGVALMPTMHVDEMGMTHDKYVPVNTTVTSLPLRITFDRSDLVDPKASTRSNTATAGGMSPARWRLLSHLSESIEKQKQMGFEQSDIDDIKRLIADTNITLLAITFLASALHMLFEFLTFKNEISFWQSNSDLTGLSVRSLFLDLIGQSIILVFLIEEQSSLLTIIPSGIGCLIALWKCQRGSGLQFVKLEQQQQQYQSIREKTQVAWWNWLPRIFGYELRAIRLEAHDKNKNTTDPLDTNSETLIQMTLEADRIATQYLGSILLPFVGGYALYSFVYMEHAGWYSWIVTTSASAVYALGFVLMTPQLFLNWKLKSVAHLPWRVLVYKSLNTFIDDLFSFIIRMPTMARIGCFRDDVVFFVYLYQRWLYPVDTSRPIEGGGEMHDSTKTLQNKATNQTSNVASLTNIKTTDATNDSKDSIAIQKQKKKNQ